MNKNIDLTNLLKDCPKGMPLDCTMFDDVTFIGVEKKIKPISIRSGEIYYYLTEFGTWSYDENAKCIIFPKGKTSWEGFQRPFKDGDIAISDDGDIHLLRTSDSSYCAYRERWQRLPKFDSTITTCIKVDRLATEEEKQKLFSAIKANGYMWNKETKTLEKYIEPKFKVGDKVVKKGGINIPVLITEVSGENYYSNTENSVGFFKIKEQDNWELVPNKFNPKTLQPFDKVLVRMDSYSYWYATFFSHIDDFKSSYEFVTTASTRYKHMIPYNEETKHLLGTCKQEPEFYRY